ncbi:succinylglutamate desuccinylase/aspartoacylase family protein [Leptothoe sp. PORK10 BA2]|uniref:succinylglutamate desuccinylase/aspartoacylase family protein n=1 Tax=Leptothoe sp. PORK10 BA2 TaxID=3110254 RepID=UPI002B20E07A|nr:succinylglutamate desuccinylase/aspartoacylase family protein [Leptothoe sp. PORK10 BA2]MEA5464659.1 succinylglutamate desuccinylase/aspartoacylase family protein [Leptothoe sp. PORK10 BA2]
MSSRQSLDFPGAYVVNELDLDHWPQGTCSKLMVDLINDGLGRSLRLPVMVGRGNHPGPVLGLTAVLHGNELNGISVIHRLFETLDLQALRGTIVGVIVVNVPAYLNNERTFDDRTDMNHVMPGKANGNIAEIYAHRFLERIVRRFEYLIDLHTASFGNVNSLYVRADMTHEVTANMAYLQRPQIILHNSPSDRTLRGAAMEMGIPSITVEIGDPQVFQSRHIKASLSGVRRVMSDIGMLPRRPLGKGPLPVLCEQSIWLYADHGGLLKVLPKPTDLVQANDVIAQQRDIFGQVICEYRAPYDGIVIGKSVNPVAQTGSRILNLGAIATPNDHPFYRWIEDTASKAPSLEHLAVQ